ncbi:peptidase C26 [Leptothrix cholodnii SP-6]|uniref:Peptidase C26 n=1 Tax=Leptothrix cholodnii (strain ATCC 51168 / LMG 8142 / SP-6) TaxID=395495 RepID=B1Y1M2_LEPCP|nr:gamma-glutamyl-gamma-aminobutyrate hydrolase family protein [Leptothrix cholodnii]ACB35484.1 peptidase C26 [Leptothrix cholodnii SP-6]
MPTLGRAGALSRVPAYPLPVRERPLLIGMSARLMHVPPVELGFRGKTLQYLEQSLAHWIMAHGAMAVMIPTLGFDAEVERRKVGVHHYVDMLDGLVLQGGADVSPLSYGQQPLRPEWAGDAVRDRYEIELIDGFLTQGKPMLGICRGCQLLNVAFGGSLLQDINTQRPDTRRHVDGVLYDQLQHGLRFEPGSRLEKIYDGHASPRVNSIHHQAVDRLGSDLVVEARCDEDGVVEAIRSRGDLFVAGVQWHPEFHLHTRELLDAEPLMNAWLAAVKARRDGTAAPG